MYNIIAHCGKMLKIKRSFIMSTSINTIPNNNLIGIFQYLSGKDLGRFRSLNKKFNFVVTQKCNFLWEQIFAIDFPDSYKKYGGKHHSENNFYECYRKKALVTHNIQKSTYLSTLYSGFQSSHIKCYDSKMISYHSKDSEIEIWDLEKKSQIGHSNHYTSGDFICSHIYKNSLFLGFQLAIKIISLGDEKENIQTISALRLSGGENSIKSFDIKGDKLYVRFSQGLIKVFSLNDLAGIDDKSIIDSIYYKNSNLLLSDEIKIDEISVKELNCLNKFEIKEKSIWGSSLIHGQYLFKKEDKNLRIWDLDKKDLSVISDQTFEHSIVNFFVHGNLVCLVPRHDNLITIYDLETNTQQDIKFEVKKRFIQELQIHDRKLFCAYDYHCAYDDITEEKGAILIWDLASLQQIGRIPLQESVLSFHFNDNKLVCNIGDEEGESEDEEGIDFGNKIHIYDFSPNNPSNSEPSSTSLKRKREED